MRTGVSARGGPVGQTCERGCANRHKHKDQSTRNVIMCKILKVLGRELMGTLCPTSIENNVGKQVPPDGKTS